jgi:hypothetical protein
MTVALPVQVIASVSVASLARIRVCYQAVPGGGADAGNG